MEEEREPKVPHQDANSPKRHKDLLDCSRLIPSRVSTTGFPWPGYPVAKSRSIVLLKLLTHRLAGPPRPPSRCAARNLQLLLWVSGEGASPQVLDHLSAGGRGAQGYRFRLQIRSRFKVTFMCEVQGKILICMGFFFFFFLLEGSKYREGAGSCR